MFIFETVLTILNKLSDLSTFALIVSAMRQMAIVFASVPGFNDLGRSVTPNFPLMDHFFYLISYDKRKNEENLSTRSLNFL